MGSAGSPRIPEAYFEYKATFSNPVFEMWANPSLLLSSLYSNLKRWNVSLSDVSWKKDAVNYQEVQVSFNVRTMNAEIRVGLDSATFIAVNPDWSKAGTFVELFQSALRSIQQDGRIQIASQVMALAFHITTGESNFKEAMGRLVNSSLIGPAEAYGISAYRDDSSLVMDKSVRYEGGIFVRIQRNFAPTVAFADLAMSVYEDEVKALTLLGVPELIKEG